MSGDARKPHGRDCPLMCSMCRGAIPRVVTLHGAEVLVDGKPESAVAGDDAKKRYYTRGAAHGRKPKQ